MNKKRLDHLATFLREQVPSSHFNLNSWMAGHDFTEAKLKAHTCGTSACAVGWACVMPSFQKAGLRLYNGAPHFENHSSWNAVEAFFELGGKEALALFSNTSYLGKAKPVQVADRIELFIRDGDAAVKEAREAEDENEMLAENDPGPVEDD